MQFAIFAYENLSFQLCDKPECDSCHSERSNIWCIIYYNGWFLSSLKNLFLVIQMQLFILPHDVALDVNNANASV